jgi:hypothetical protein
MQTEARNNGDLSSDTYNSYKYPRGIDARTAAKTLRDSHPSFLGRNGRRYYGPYAYRNYYDDLSYEVRKTHPMWPHRSATLSLHDLEQMFLECQKPEPKPEYFPNLPTTMVMPKKVYEALQRADSKIQRMAGIWDMPVIVSPWVPENHIYWLNDKYVKIKPVFKREQGMIRYSMTFDPAKEEGMWFARFRCDCVCADELRDMMRAKAKTSMERRVVDHFAKRECAELAQRASMILGVEVIAVTKQGEYTQRFLVKK